MKGSIPSKADIKLVRSLSQKKFREQTGLFVVEGEKMVAEALTCGLDVVSVYYQDEISQDVMSRMTLLSSPSPALAVVRKPKPRELSQIIDPSMLKGVSLALDSIRDPGNMGTILRLADWFGIENIYASEDCVDVFNPKAVQSSMGSVLRRRIDYVPLRSVVDAYKKEGIAVYATTLDGENIHAAELSRDNALIIMGSENNGVSPEILSMVTDRLFIPPYPIESTSQRSESLNVAIASAILCYEFRKG